MFQLQPMTNIALKVPLFYLVDSLIKNVGGMYIDLFSAHIVIAFQRIFAEVSSLYLCACSCVPIRCVPTRCVPTRCQVNDTDKARLDFLLSTWEEGMIFHRDVLRQMRAFIGRRIVCVRHAVSASR